MEHEKAIQEFVDKQTRMAMRCISAGLEFRPLGFLFLVSSTGFYRAIPVPGVERYLTNGADRRQLRAHFAAVWEVFSRGLTPGSAKLLSVIFISDAWYYMEHCETDEEMQKLTKNAIRSSLHPNRKEAVTVLDHRKEIRYSSMHPYSRKGPVIVFDHDPPGRSSNHPLEPDWNLTNLWPPHA